MDGTRLGDTGIDAAGSRGSRSPASAVWPTDDQRLLLRAALCDGPPAIEAFRAWAERNAVESAEWASARLMPLVLENLTRLGFDPPDLSALAARQLASWVRSEYLMRCAAGVLASLEQAGIRTLCIKGLALAQGFYARPALRPMTDIDVVVHRTDIAAVIEALLRDGWRSRVPLAGVDPWIQFPGGTAAFDRGPDEAPVDLHWRILHERNADPEPFWHSAIAMEVLGVRAARPSATWLLVHAIMHGLRVEPGSPIRWIPDAAMLLRQEREAIDWPELVRYAIEARIAHRLALGLGYLRTEFGLPVPAEVVAALGGRRVTTLERLEAIVLLKPDRAPAWLVRLLGNASLTWRILLSRDARDFLPQARHSLSRPFRTRTPD